MPPTLSQLAFAAVVRAEGRADTAWLDPDTRGLRAQELFDGDARWRERGLRVCKVLRHLGVPPGGDGRLALLLDLLAGAGVEYQAQYFPGMAAVAIRCAAAGRDHWGAPFGAMCAAPLRRACRELCGQAKEA